MKFNPFEINNIDTIKELLNIIVISYCAILGIIASLMFFYFSFVQQRYKRYTEIYINSISFSRLFIIVLLNLLVGFYFLSQIGKNEIVIFKSYYTNLFIFTITIVYLFFKIKRSIISAYNKKIYLDIISEIGPFDVELYKFGAIYDGDERVLLLEKNNIYIISELLLNYLDNGDIINSRIIIFELERRFEGMISKDIGKQGITVRDLLNSLSVIYEKLLNYAIELKNSSIIYNIYKMTFRIHKYCASNQIPRSEYFEFDGFISQLTNKILIFGEKKLNKTIYIAPSIYKRII